MTRTMIRLAISGLVFLVFMVHSSGWHAFRLLSTVESFTYDARVLLTLPRTNDPRVVVMDLDERSLAAEGQWPWPRDKMARLVNQVFDTYHARVLGFDIVFAEPDRRAADLLDRLAAGELADLPGLRERVPQLRSRLDHDQAFADAIKDRPVVMGFFVKQALSQGEAAASGALCAPVMDKTATSLYAVDFIKPAGYGGNVPVLQAATPYCGFFDNPIVDEDGVFRRVPLLQVYDGQVYPSLALAVTRLALGNPAVQLEFDPPDARNSLHLERVRIGNLTAPVDGDVAVYVPYRGDNRTFTYVSATDVLNGKADAAALKDAIVLMGTTAAGLLDFRTTPVNKIFAGVEVHANIVSGILGGHIRQKAPYYSGIETVLLLLIGLAMALVFPRFSALAGAGLALGILAGLTALALALWQWGNFIMPLGVPVLFTLALFTAHLLYGYFVESRKARDISRMFGEYVPPEIVSEMADRGGEISMEGESREMTVLFSDVRGFTSISEKLDAKDLSLLMNEFLTQQTGVIQKYRGTIDKYMGDAIMAFWGAPLPNEHHALDAVRAGMEMLKAVRGLDATFAQRGWPPLNIGVGLNTGKMSVGNMGSSFRRAYTVMGDAVNLGSRLEGLTKEYGVGIIVSEFTRNQLPSDWAFRELDVVRVKGKNEPVAIYEPLGPKEELDPALRQDLARHRGALKLYREQKWDDAEQEFFTLSQSPLAHPVYAKFLERILFLRENPPGKAWDGAFTFDHK
ncbi:MAG: adenylate/guanylate cyclase domain-containing protein [Nevskiaceae bacterium]|nr:MAG: adenylate/guanylate cyclase domain-containing protein [Nevskiaceae bacterium]